MSSLFSVFLSAPSAPSAANRLPRLAVRPYVAAPRLDDHGDVRARVQAQRGDGRGDDATDPRQVAGADDDLGVVAVREDADDGAGDHVAGAQTGDGSAGQEDLLGEYGGDDRRARRQV